MLSWVFISVTGSYIQVQLSFKHGVLGIHISYWVIYPSPIKLQAWCPGYSYQLLGHISKSKVEACCPGHSPQLLGHISKSN